MVFFKIKIRHSAWEVQNSGRNLVLLFKTTQTNLLKSASVMNQECWLS